jgi:hypothetical protein
MNIKPTKRTAALAGIWASVGLTPFDSWLESAKLTSTLTYNLTFLSFSAVFFVLPALFLVIGLDTGAFSRFWILDPVERAKYRVVAERMFVWFISAGITGFFISIAMNNYHIP